MAQNPVPDLSAGDPTPELTEASLLQAVQVINKFGFNIEIPSSAVVGPIVMRRNVTIASPGMTVVPAQTDGFGAKLALTHGKLRSTLLQQSVDTNDERVYLMSNASGDSGSTYTGNLLYDKVGAAATYYLQRAGEHTFATAPVAVAIGTAVFTTRARIDASGIVIPTGKLTILNQSNIDAAFLTATSTGNTSSFSINGVQTTDAYLKGLGLGDSAVRAEVNNLGLGSFNGNTIIGTATATIARFNSSGNVIIPGSQGLATTNASLGLGGGFVMVVGAGQNSISVNKGIWVYQNASTNPNNGFGIQLNGNAGMDMHVGNTTNGYNRVLNLQTNGKALFGGVAGATAIGDVHINQVGVDGSGALSLTGQSGPSYILMGNRDSNGTAGPFVIVSANRAIQFGVGNDYFQRTGGSFSPLLTIDGNNTAVGVNFTPGSGSNIFTVGLTGASAIAQSFVTTLATAVADTTGNPGGGAGFLWNGQFVGQRVYNGGSSAAAGLAIYTVTGGASGLAAQFLPNKSLSIVGDTININGVGSIATNGAQVTYVRGSAVTFQNVAANQDIATFSTSGTTINGNITNNGNVTLNGTLIVTRQIEATADKAFAATTVYDWNVASVWFTSNPTGNWTANFTNLPTATSQVMSCTVIVQQGASAYYPAAIQIGGSAVTIKWAGGMAPVPTPNNVDAFNFSFIRTSSGGWIVLGSATPYV